MRRSHRPAPVLAILVLTLSTLAITALLAACGGGATSTPPPDTTAPSLTITSQTTAAGATYHLTGKTSDNVGATKITYTVDGGPTKTVDLTGGTFDITVTLQAGQNTIDVKAYDAAGNVKDVVFHVTYTPPPGTTGSLKVTIQNLPSGSPANVDVTGPSSYSKNVTGTTTLNNLAPGTYTITPHDVFVNLVDFKGAATPSSVSVTAGATASTTVAYTATYGFLDLTVTGLPSGVNADITVTGPGSYSQSVTKTTTLSALNKGDYTITAKNVTQTTTKDAFSPTVTGSPASVVPSQHTTASVAYARTTDHLTVNISGLPSGANAAVTVTGNKGFGQSITGTTTLTGLADDTYTVTAANVSSGGKTYVPTASSQQVQLQNGKNGSVDVAYAVPAPTTGTLTVTISGLKNGAPGYVKVTGPSGSGTPASYTLQADATLNNLAPGTYTVTVNNVSGNLYDYTGTAAQASVTVPSGGSATDSVTYTATTGALSLAMTGLPGSTAAGVSMTGPGGPYFADTTHTFGHLQPAAYTLATKQVKGSDGELYDDTADNGATVQVTAGATATKTLAFVQVSGDLSVTINGGVTSPRIDIYGVGTVIDTVTQTTTVKGLYAAPGGTTYGIVPNPLKESNYDWSGTVVMNNANVTSAPIQRGQTTSVSVNYVATTGAISLIVNSRYVAAGNVDITKVSSGAALVTGASVGFNKVFPYQQPVKYALTVHPVHSSDYDYGMQGYQTMPVDFTYQFLVSAGNTASFDVEYVPIDGKLVLNFSGPIPSDSGGSTKTYTATVTDTATGSTYKSASKQVSSSTISTSVAYPYTPNSSYAVTAPTRFSGMAICSTLPTANYKQYTPTIQSSPASITSGTTTSVAVIYTETTVPCN